MSKNFNGTTSSIGLLLGSSETFPNGPTATPMSLLAWISPVNLGEGSSGRIIGRGLAVGGIGGHWFLGLRAPSTFWGTVDYIAANVITIATIGTIDTNGTWQHIAMTWSGSSNATGMKLYKNAVEVAYGQQTTGGGSYVVNTVNAVVIGNVGNASSTFNGQISHVHIYRMELTSNQIRQLMSHPASVLAQGSVTSVGTSGLVGYWPLATASSNAYDLSGNMHMGTSTTIVSGSTEAQVNETFIVSYPCGAMAM